MLDIIRRNVKKLEDSVGRLVGTNEMSMIPFELKTSLVKTCDKLNAIVEASHIQFRR